MQHLILKKSYLEARGLREKGHWTSVCTGEARAQKSKPVVSDLLGLGTNSLRKGGAKFVLDDSGTKVKLA